MFDLEFERNKIYDELCAVLTQYEEDSTNVVSVEDLYEMLVKIHNNWETVITAEVQQMQMM